MNKTVKALATTTFLLLLVVTMAGVASATLTITPGNSHIFQLNGTQFTPNANVTIQLRTEATAVNYTFTNATTDALGNFSVILIVPTNVTGGVTYNVTALTNTTIIQFVNQAIPNLTGATGATGKNGTTGATGATGATGPPGEPTSNDLAYGAIIISVLALIVAAIAAFLKKKA